MRTFILRVYRLLFVRKAFYAWHHLLFRLSLRGLGILNYEDCEVSGEAYLLRWISRRRSPLCVLDVGANVGEYSSKLKSLVPSATVYAFEPHPLTYQRLEREALQSGFTPVNMACSDVEGEATLYDCSSEVAGSRYASLHREVIERVHQTESTSWQVACTTIDRFLERAGVSHVDLLKIDTEGSELRVLRGAKKTIDRGAIDVIQFEFNEMNVATRVFLRDFLDALDGYEFFRLLPDGLVPLDRHRPVFLELFAYQNVVALRYGLHP